MSYLVLARKWRPQGFDAITGQDHVTRTLKNAIRQNRVHHAFLFCGARGVGKTTAARVFAKALNCASSESSTVDPCGTCDACREIAAGTAVDVYEIDGASNRGIGEIRELRDGVAYAPQRDRFKIYIIDEVHMLTTEAFNALLKTLEEPPAHVKFIFATTEPHKIPVTILSRCQRFDFKRVPREEMVARVSEILEAEGVSIAPEGLALVARESEGSMRDALSLLDRIISFCGQQATYDDVASVLGVADRRWLGDLVGAALAGDVPKALTVVEEAFGFGLDFRQLSTDIVHYLRDVLVLKVAGPAGGLTELSQEETQRLHALGADHAVEDLQRLVNVMITTAERLVHANFPRLEMEMAVIRMCRLKPLRPVDDLIARLAQIERSLTSGEPLPDPPSGPGGGSSGGPGGPGGSGGPGGQRPATQAHAASAAPPMPAAPPAPAPAAPRPTIYSPPTTTRADATPPANETPAPPAQPPPQVPAAPAHPTRAAHDAPTAPPQPPQHDQNTPPAPAAPVQAVSPAAPAPTAPRAPDARPAPTPRPAELIPAPRPRPIADIVASVPRREPPADPGPLTVERFEEALEAYRATDPALTGLLANARPTLRDDRLILTVASSASAARARLKLDQIRAALGLWVDADTAVEVVVEEALADTPHARELRRQEAAREVKKHELENHRVVRDVIERFGGTLAGVRLYDASPADALASEAS